MKTESLFIFAGEQSGDTHGAKLVRQIKKLQPTLKIYGVCGPKMRKEEIESVLPMEEFEVIGFKDIFFALPRLIKNFYRLRSFILKKKPRGAIFIDYPGFTLRLEKTLRKKGYRNTLIHYISPTVWVWGKKRIPLMEKNVDLLLTIFPFEKTFFHNSFLAVEYVGNPLMEQEQNDHEILVPSIDFPLIGLFPGSRKKEIIRNFPIHLKVAQNLWNQNKRLNFFVSISHENFRSLIQDSIHSFPLEFQKQMHLILPSQHRFLIQQAIFCIAKSGTITLELALQKMPTIVTYAVKPFDLFIIQNILKIDLPHYCIVNILAGKRIFPELYGPNFTEKKLFAVASDLLTDEEKRKDIKRSCEKIQEILGNKQASVEAANAILSHLNRGTQH